MIVYVVTATIRHETTDIIAVLPSEEDAVTRANAVNEGREERGVWFYDFAEVQSWELDTGELVDDDVFFVFLTEKR